MRYLNLFACVVAILVVLGGCSSAPKHQAKGSGPPNIVLIITDDLGAGELGCYGQEIIRTPNIDELAARGMLFTNAYSGSAVCAPSRCSLLTGLHTGHSAIRDNKELEPTGQQPLPAESITLAQVLKSRGYATAAVGKWGLGPAGSTGDPSKHGFDHFFGYLCQRHAHNHCPTYLYRDGDIVNLPGNKERWESGVVPAGATYAPDLFREEAERFMSANRSGPFFLMFATEVPHLALQVPEDSLAEYAGVIDDAPYDGKKGYLSHPTPRAAYAAMVTRMDRDVGHMLAHLKALGLEDNTIVIFTSDNGPTYTGGADSTFFKSASGLRGLKGQLYEGGIRVPLIVSWPGQIGARATNSTNSTLTGNWDLMPTLAAAAGIRGSQLPANLDGIDLAPALFSNATMERDHLYWEYASAGGWQAVRMGSFKAVRRNVMKAPAGPIEVYRLDVDPMESTNVAAAHPEIVERARQIMAGRTRSEIAEWNFE